MIKALSCFLLLSFFVNSNLSAGSKIIWPDQIDWYNSLSQARAISAKFARLMNRSIGAMSADFGAKYRQYKELATDLIGKEETEPVSPFVSGWKKDQKEDFYEDSNREAIFGRKGVHDNDRVYPSGDETYSSYKAR